MWDIERLDINAYLARIGHDGVLDPTLDTLRALHQAHAATIPFENLDILLGRGISLDIDDLQAKLVRHRRGGYCYEHNLLFAALLERLGFRVTRMVARVLAGTSKPRTHMLLNVDLDGDRWLADVGFGAALLEPIPLVDGLTVQQGDWSYGLERRDDTWVLRSLGENGCSDMYAFAYDPQLPIDYAVYNHYTSTHPRSPFTGQVVAIRTTPNTRFTLRGRELTVIRPVGTDERRELGDTEFANTLRDTFAIDLPAADLARLTVLPTL